MKSFSNTAHADADAFLLLAEEQMEGSTVVLTSMVFTMIGIEVYAVTCTLLGLFYGYQPTLLSLQEMVEVREGLGIKAPLEFPWPVKEWGVLQRKSS